MAKKYDIVCTVGEYKDNNGDTKKRYLNVGAIMSNDNGHYMLLDKTFNPAGLAEAGKSAIILSLFEPKPREGQQLPQQQPQQQPPPVDNSYHGDEDLPF